ncbi:MAG: hypothetical protein WAK40_06300 [Thermoplasmata archaeon]
MSYEPIINVYQTLVNYNGNSTTTFVPTVATCVPGDAQCTSDYGSSLVADGAGPFAGEPIYWTFVIDKQASFYDPTTHASWGVYPSDVMFSLARTLAFSEVPYVGKNPGWIQAQSLLQYGSPVYDGGLHYPFNTTANSILSSMLVNSTAYCPASAIANEHGCVTFVANGGGSDWPYFLQLVADNLGASVEPCGWFSYEGAAMPGFANFGASHGDGPCGLPGSTPGHLITSTDSSAWAAYLAGVDPLSWDSFEETAVTSPIVDGGVQWNMVGSGPYYAGVIPGAGYTLAENPAYLQPGGCSGVGVAATYGGYCDPAPSAFIHNVQVYWEPDDSFGISQYRAHIADFAGIEAAHTTTLKLLASEGDLNYFINPTITQFFTPVNLRWSPSEFSTYFPSEPLPNIPVNFFTNPALREFYVEAYPYTTVENTIRTVDGIQFDFNAGGAIPVGLGNYYPTNVSFPNTDPDLNPSDVGGSAWWWAQANNPISSYYDPQLASCSHATPCTFPIAGLDADPSDDAAIADWMAEITTITGGALAPYTFDLTFDQFLDIAFNAPGTNPLISETGSGWAPDYPDPTDYTVPEVGPNATYTAADAFSGMVGEGTQTSANISACGHYGSTIQDLDYWAHSVDNPALGRLTTQCQGVAYTVAVNWMGIAAGLPVGPDRTLDYNLITHITNALGMYVWNGQANAVSSAAPWIDPSSLNTNVMIGGGGDAVWFQVRYVPFEQSVTFKESGITAGAGTAFTVTAGSPSTEKTSANVTGPATSVPFNAPNGTLDFTVTAPAGYGLAKVTGPHGTLYGSAPISATTTITLHFGKLQTVNFNEVTSVPWPGLPALTTWGITLVPSGTGGPAGSAATTTGSTVTFTIAKGTPYKYEVTKPAIYDAAPAHGGLSVGSVTVNKAIKFKLNAGAITFSEHGLAAHTSWSVTVTGPVPGSPITLSSTSATIKFELPNGTYTYTIPVVGGDTGTGAPASPIVVAPVLPSHTPHAQTIHVTFAPEHQSFGPAVTRLSTALASHAGLVATVSGREAA